MLTVAFPAFCGTASESLMATIELSKEVYVTECKEIDVNIWKYQEKTKAHPGMDTL